MTKSGTMLLNGINCSYEIKDKDFIAKKIREVILEVGLSNTTTYLVFKHLLNYI